MKPKILFIGGTRRGFAVLRSLIEKGGEIVYSYIMKEDEHETIKVSQEIKNFCDKRKIDSKLCKKVSIDDFSAIKELNADVAVVCGWRTIIHKEVYSNIPIGCIAAHDSLLPKYRGFAPINWAIINGDKETGVTLFRIEDGEVDSGPICGQEKVAIGENETADDVYQKIVKATVDLYLQFYSDLETDSLTWTEQNEEEATYAMKRTPEDGKINWAKPANEIYNFIRALSPPYPCAWTYVKGEKILITKARVSSANQSSNNKAPGEIVSIQDDGLLVSCGKNQIIICDLVNESKENVSINAPIFSESTIMGES